MYNYYNILGVDRDATPAEIEEAYKAKLFEYDPQRHPDDLEGAHYVTMQINEAYDHLGYPETRDAYDASLADQSSFGSSSNNSRSQSSPSSSSNHNASGSSESWFDSSSSTSPHP